MCSDCGESPGFFDVEGELYCGRCAAFAKGECPSCGKKLRNCRAYIVTKRKHG